VPAVSSNRDPAFAPRAGSLVTAIDSVGPFGLP